MTTPFEVRVHKALQDPDLGGALQTMSRQLTSRRALAFQSLAASDSMRDLARKAKLDTLRDLAANLERFERRLASNGAHVHWAETGADANRIVAEIATQHGVRRVAKAKSMVSEEIHLNASLERAGIEVVETDLGEYIVQWERRREVGGRGGEGRKGGGEGEGGERRYRDRWACLWRHLSRTGWRDPDAWPARSSGLGRPAKRKLPLRRVP